MPQKNTLKCLFLYLLVSFIGRFSYTELIDAFDKKASEEVVGVGEQDRKHEDRGNVNECSEYAERADHRHSHVVEKAYVTSVKIVEVDLERIGDGRRNYHVDREEDAHYLHIALRAEAAESKSDGKHKVKHDEIVEGYRVKSFERDEEALNAFPRIYETGRKDHSGGKRGEGGESRGVGYIAVLTVVEGVKRQKEEEERAIMERKRVKVVATALCGVDLLNYLKDEKQYRDDLQRNIFKLRLAFSERFCRDKRRYGKNQKRRHDLVKMRYCPKPHKSSFPSALLRRFVEF